MTNGNGPDERVLANSVVDRPSPPSKNNAAPSYDMGQIFWMMGNVTEEIRPFGAGKLRDAQLRNFITKEPYFASALGIIGARNAGFSWTIDGPPRSAVKYQEILDTANIGAGWRDLIMKTSIDVYTQDSGAAWELVREEDNPAAPVIGINHLDIAKCYHTGAPQAPLIYQDKQGKYHLLRWYNVVTFSEMPVPIEGMYGMQYSALTRLLLGMQISRNIEIYKYEKTSGRQNQAVVLVKGITSQQLEDAFEQARSVADGSGLTRFAKPLFVGSIDPKADVGHDLIELAGLPDGFDEEVWFKHYMNLIAMAFASDYQDFAPLPGGGLGTGNQSEMLHLKSRGKGPAQFMKMISYAINWRVLPKNLQFEWTEQDLEAEKSEADVQYIRAQTRSVRLLSGEITPQVARQIANDDGDLKQEFMDLMGEEDITENVIVRDETQGDAQVNDSGKPIRPGQAGPNTIPTSRRPTATPPPRGANRT